MLLNFVDDAHLALTCHIIAVSAEKEEISPLSLVLDEGLVLPGTPKPSVASLRSKGAFWLTCVRGIAACIPCFGISLLSSHCVGVSDTETGLYASNLQAGSSQR